MYIQLFITGVDEATIGAVPPSELNIIRESTIHDAVKSQIEIVPPSFLKAQEVQAILFAAMKINFGATEAPTITVAETL